MGLVSGFLKLKAQMRLAHRTGPFREVPYMATSSSIDETLELVKASHFTLFTYAELSFPSPRVQMHPHPEHQQTPSSIVDPDPQLPSIKIHHPASPRHHSSTSSGATPTPTAGARRKIGVAVDLSDESSYAVRWAVQHYIRPGDAVILLHVSPTSVLFGADWGSIDVSIHNTPDADSDVEGGGESNHDQNRSDGSKRKLEDDFDACTASKVVDLAKPLKDAQIPFKIHIVKDHDMRERLCLEVERLGLHAVIMGSRGFGAAKRGSDGKLGSVSDYCVHHCVCPVVVLRYPEEKDSISVAAASASVAAVKDSGDLAKD